MQIVWPDKNIFCKLRSLFPLVSGAANVIVIVALPELFY